MVKKLEREVLRILLRAEHPMRDRLYEADALILRAKLARKRASQVDQTPPEPVPQT